MRKSNEEARADFVSRALNRLRRHDGYRADLERLAPIFLKCAAKAATDPAVLDAFLWVAWLARKVPRLRKAALEGKDDRNARRRARRRSDTTARERLASEFIDEFIDRIKPIERAAFKRDARLKIGRAHV